METTHCKIVFCSIDSPVRKQWNELLYLNAELSPFLCWLSSFPTGWGMVTNEDICSTHHFPSDLVSQGQKSAVLSWMKHCQKGVYQLPSAQKNKVKCRLLLLAGQNVHVQTELTCLFGALYLVLKSWGTQRRRKSIFSTWFHSGKETFFRFIGELTFSPFQTAILLVSKEFSFIYSSHPWL